MFWMRIITIYFPVGIFCAEDVRQDSGSQQGVGIHPEQHLMFMLEPRSRLAPTSYTSLSISLPDSFCSFCLSPFCGPLYLPPFKRQNGRRLFLTSSICSALYSICQPVVLMLSADTRSKMTCSSRSFWRSGAAPEFDPLRPRSRAPSPIPLVRVCQ